MIHEHSGLRQVGDLIGVYPNLMDSFRDFLLQCEKNGNQSSSYFLQFQEKNPFLTFVLLFLAEGLLSGIVTKSKSSYVLQRYVSLVMSGRVFFF